MIGANHKQAIFTVVERKSGHAVIAKAENKTDDPISAEIVNRLKPFGTIIKTLTFDNGKELGGHDKID
jgi:IS30 family transposase